MAHSLALLWGLLLESSLVQLLERWLDEQWGSLLAPPLAPQWALRMAMLLGCWLEQH